MKKLIKNIISLSLVLTMVFNMCSFAGVNGGTEDIVAPKAVAREDHVVNDGLYGGTEMLEGPEKRTDESGRLYEASGTTTRGARGGYNYLGDLYYSNKTPLYAMGQDAQIGISPSGDKSLSTFVASPYNNLWGVSGVSQNTSTKDLTYDTYVPANSALVDSVPTNVPANVITNNIYNNVSMNIPSNDVSVSAESAILINATTGQIYYEKNSEKTQLPAGLVNLMTAYLAINYKDLANTLTVNYTAIKNIDPEASIAALTTGDKITLKDALAAIFVKGCVDCSNVIAENVSGSISAFVELMNTTAKEMGCKNTVFKNPTGLDEDGQVTTAYDMAILMDKLTDYSDLVELMSLTQYQLPKSKKREALLIYSKNTMLAKDSPNYNSGIACSRLGYTKNAEYTIASEFEYANNKFVIVVLKAKGTQFTDTKKLYEFAKKVCDGK